MTEPEVAQVRAPEPITISILRLRNLKGHKGDNLQAMVKLEFGDKNLGESPKVDCKADIAAELNYNATLNCTYEDSLVIDEIAHKPVVLTLIEVLPKEKKQKEEKTVPLGQVSIDLLPLVRGEVKCQSTLTLNPMPGSSLENLPADVPKPEVDIQLSVNEPLLDDGQLSEGNLMTVTVESCFSPPESWQAGLQYIYTATMPIPVNSEKEIPIVFSNGSLKPGSEKEVPNKQKKWLAPGMGQAGAIYIPDSFLSNDAVEDEDGDFMGKEDREHRAVSESEKNRVTWNTERRCFLEMAAVKSLQEKIAKTRYWPVEVMRLPMPQGGGKGKKEEDGTIGYHGIAYVNMAPLLYPGVKRIRGAYKVYAYTDQGLFEKTKRKTGFAEEAAKIATNAAIRNTISPFPKKTGKEKEGADKKEGVKKGQRPPTDAETSQTMKSDAASDVDGQTIVNIEGQQYLEARSYIMLEISLSRPLVPKRPADELAKRVAEYIPPRPLFPKRTNGAQKAVEDYHVQIGNVASLILDEFRDLFGDELAAGELQTNKEMETRRQKLLYEINSSGKYFAFKEQLKHAVVKIVREKYLKTKHFDDKNELQMFLSELYVYLVDQMHVALGQQLALEDQAPIPEPLTDSAQLKHFAREAEVNENYDLAAKYYQERIARNKNSADHWFDYGTFCLYINDLTKAEECFKECVAIDQKHLHGLLLYGVVSTITERNETAETFFEAATCVDPKSILAWTMLGLFYDAVNNEIGAEMAYLEANKLNQSAAVALAKPPKDYTSLDTDEMATESGKADISLSISNEGGLAGSNVHPTPPASDKPPTSARSGQKVSEKKLSAHGKRVSVSSAVIAGKNTSRPGSRQHVAGSYRVTPQPADDPEDIPPREPTPIPTSSVFMQAVSWLLEVKAIPFTERALAHELLSPLGGPSATFYLSLARANLQKREFTNAVDNLNEALQCDHQNPDSWSMMGHVKYLTGDSEGAQECYERTLSFISEASEMHSIYLRLASIYLQEARFKDAKNTFLLACKKSPSCVSWLGVGIACFRLGELSEAEDALSEANILNNSDPEVWGYLALVCLQTGRQLEAEQAYKYAVKVNLQDDILLDEIHNLQREVGFGNPQL